MEMIILMIGTIASGLTIWDFVNVRLKKRKAKAGVEIEEFNESIASSYDFDKEYRIPNESDLSKGDWSWAYDGERLPFITYGNFFGDGKLSEALVLISKKNEHAKIIVKKHGESNYIELISPSNSPYKSCKFEYVWADKSVPIKKIRIRTMLGMK